jgi:ribA/ribD-fused uncharacterized protein
MNKLPKIINKEDCIFFFSHHPKKDDKYNMHVFSQFYPCIFQDDNEVIYNCAEQYMMGMKAKIFDPEMLPTIMNETNPGSIKALGRRIRNFNQAEWDAVKYNIVRTGNYYKFKQNPELLSILLASKGKYLVEASFYDRIWGIGYRSNNVPNETDKWGLNLLGKALMEVRYQLE